MNRTPSPPPDPNQPLLAVDSGSPGTSVAVARGGHPLAVRAAAGQASSAALLRLIDEALSETAVERGELGALVAAGGPGSFTGLRVALATVLGLSLALRIPATAVPTLEAIAVAAGRRPHGVLAVVDALRGEWHAQAFDGWPPEASGQPELVSADALGSRGPGTVAGFGLQRLAARSSWPEGVAAFEPGPLAPALVELVAARPPAWDSGRLVRPIYLRPPAVTPPAPRRRA